MFLKGVAGLAGLPLVSRFAAPARGAVQQAGGVRPGEPGWPGPAEWAKLREDVGGRLVQVESPFAACMPDPGGAACTGLFQNRGAKPTDAPPLTLCDGKRRMSGQSVSWLSECSPLVAETNADPRPTALDG